LYVSGGNAETRLTNNAVYDGDADWGYLATGKLGDIDGSGAVDQNDVLSYLKYLAGVNVDPAGLPNGDLDCSGQYAAFDVLVLLKYLAGMTSTIGC
jgi:hypothetical protein